MTMLLSAYAELQAVAVRSRAIGAVQLTSDTMSRQVGTGNVSQLFSLRVSSVDRGVNVFYFHRGHL